MTTRDVRLVHQKLPALLQTDGKPLDEVRLYLCSNFHSTVADPNIVGPPPPGGGSHRWPTFQEVLNAVPTTAHVAVLSEHPEAGKHLDKLVPHADKHRQLLIVPLGLHHDGPRLHNSVAVAYPDAKRPILLNKLSLSFGDCAERDLAGNAMEHGKILTVFEAEGWKLCVLNCHEYTHTDILAAVHRVGVDLLVVTTRNQASQLYDEYAVSDIHRLSCFVVVNNSADYGGCGVYAPFSRVGNEQDAVHLGGTLFASRGPCETSVLIPLPLGDLRKFRQEFHERPKVGSWYQHIDPPEQVKSHPAAPLHHTHIAGEKANPLEVIKLTDLGYRRRGDGSVRVAVGQLRSMGLNDYKDNSYHISRSANCERFSNGVRAHLELLSQATVLNPQAEPDILVLPEVFLPLSLEGDIKAFSLKHNTIIVAGVEYDAQPDEEYYGTDRAKGKNRCRVYVPTASGTVTLPDYVKMTRSQYDARLPKQAEDTRNRGEFALTRGENLLRFQDDKIGSFGVLICYDLSHFDIVKALNFGTEADREKNYQPVDTLVIAAHNPYADLYRQCCLADCHRFYQFVVMCNVAQYGGSGVFGPIRTKGTSRTLMYAGANAEGIFTAHLDIEQLKRSRETSDEQLTRTAPRCVEARLIGGGKATFQRQPGCRRTRLDITATSLATDGGSADGVQPTD